MTELSTVEVKVACKFNNLASYTITMVSENKELNRFETLLEDGSVVTRALTAEDEKAGKVAAKLTLSLEEKINVPDKVNPQSFQIFKRCYAMLRYVSEADEPKIKDAEQRIKNKKMRTMHQFLMTHSNAEVHNMKGVNINTNLKSPLVIVIDETDAIRAKKIENELLTECLSIAEALFKADEKAFIDFCYSLNLPNIHLSNAETLYNKMVDTVKSNPVFFKETYNSSQKSLVAMINRAIYQPLSNGVTAIEFKNGYYQLDGMALTKSKDELVSYFNANPEALKRLEQLMGVHIPRTPLKRIETAPEISKLDKDNTPPAADVVQTQAKIKQKIYDLTHNLKKKGSQTKDDWVRYMETIKSIKEDHPTLEGYVDQQSVSMCEAQKLENPFTATLIKA